MDHSEEQEKMGILMVLVPIALFLAIISVAGYLWAVKTGQFDDLETPPHRLLFDEDNLEERKENHDG